MRIIGQAARAASALLIAFILYPALAGAQTLSPQTPSPQTPTPQLSSPQTSSPQTLSPEEQRIASYVDAHAGEALQLLERVVNTESATANLAGVRRVGRIFGAQFASLGFTAKWIEMPKEMNRAGHLFAERKGTRGRRLLLIGHLDTVLQGKRFQRDGEMLRGNGTVDMKGGDIVILYALKALQNAGALEGSRIIVALTGDEENVGAPVLASRRDLVEAARRSDVALGFEAAIGDTATVARRGSSDWRLQVTGRSAHSSGIFGEGTGSGAIFEAARILNAFYEQLRTERYLTFNPSMMVGGTEVTFDDREDRGTAGGKTNVIPQTVIVRGDLRFISEKQREAAKARMQEIVARSLPQTHAELTFEDNYPAMSPTEENYALLKVFDQASRDLGLGPVEAFDPGGRGAGDISFVAPLIAGLDGLGVEGGDSHTPDEFMESGSLPKQIKRVALLIYRLTREEKQP